MEPMKVNVSSKKDDIGIQADAFKKLPADLKEASAAEDRSRAKFDFLANMSHEMTTSLNIIIGFSQVLLDELSGELSEKQKKYVTYILRAGTNLLGIVSDMISLALAANGSAKLNIGRFSVRDFLKSAIKEFHEEAVKHNLTFHIDIAPEADIDIEADLEKLNKIMHHLLSNAVKFTPDGGSVRVSARRVRISGDRLFPSNKRD